MKIYRFVNVILQKTGFTRTKKLTILYLLKQNTKQNTKQKENYVYKNN